MNATHAKVGWWEAVGVLRWTPRSGARQVYRPPAATLASDG